MVTAYYEHSYFQLVAIEYQMTTVFVDGLFLLMVNDWLLYLVCLLKLACLLVCWLINNSNNLRLLIRRV